MLRTSLTAVEALVLLHRIVLVDIFFLELLLVAREHAERRTEEISVAAVAGVLLGLLAGAGVVVIIVATAVGTTTAIGCTGIGAVFLFGSSAGIVIVEAFGLVVVVVSA